MKVTRQGQLIIDNGILLCNIHFVDPNWNFNFNELSAFYLF